MHRLGLVEAPYVSLNVCELRRALLKSTKLAGCWVDGFVVELFGGGRGLLFAHQRSYLRVTRLVAFDVRLILELEGGHHLLSLGGLGSLGYDLALEAALQRIHR